MRGPHCRPGSVGTPSWRRGCLKETFNRAITLLTYPGISVIHHSRVACQSAQVHCLHDATEGGLVTGFREVARASGLGLAVEEGSIPVLAECQTVCQALGLDPLGLLASGALLVTVPAGDVPALLAAAGTGRYRGGGRSAR